MKSLLTANENYPAVKLILPQMMPCTLIKSSRDFQKFTSDTSFDITPVVITISLEGGNEKSVKSKLPNMLDVFSVYQSLIKLKRSIKMTLKYL